MSVRTPILTTSSEICAFAVPPHRAATRPAASAAVSDFMVFLLPWVWLYGTLLATSRETAKPTFGRGRPAGSGLRFQRWYRGVRLVAGRTTRYLPNMEGRKIWLRVFTKSLNSSV